jgi:flagellar FliL protein
MADTEEIDETEETTPKKKSKLPLIIGIVLALAGGGGGFFAVFSGMILGGEEHAEAEVHEEPTSDLPDITFVPIDPIVVSLNTSGQSQHLRFRAQLEVPSEYESDVQLLIPRVVDVLNGYLRALEPADLEATGALVRLRAQMLRRVQIVTGQGRVRDLLVMEFVLN